MYSGFVSTKHSATWIGAHQKYNRVAFSVLRSIINRAPDQLGLARQRAKFPRLKLIQHFEGVNGPDGIKTKSPEAEEPWHFYDPFDNTDNAIFEPMMLHYNNLVVALRKDDQDKAAFEASWLAHTLTDGLTPAHHYSYKQELGQLRGDGGAPDSKAKRIFIRGTSLRDAVRKTYRLMGGKGLLSTHVSFEAGVTGAILINRLHGGRPSQVELNFARKHGLIEVFQAYAREIGELNIYGRYYDKGWTTKIGRDVRYKMSPLIVRTIVIAWWLALDESSKALTDDE